MSGRNDYPHVLTCQLSPQTDPATTVISWRVSDRYLPRGVVEQGNRLVFPVDIDKAEHEGTYICLAENEMGRDQLEAVVYVEGLPKMALILKEKLLDIPKLVSLNETRLKLR